MTDSAPSLGEMYFESFAPGDTFTSAGFTITESMIVDFCLNWDPHFFHIDIENAHENEILGGHIGSGFQTLTIMMRMAFDSGMFWPGLRGGRGATDFRWLRPVLPDSTLHTDTEVLETKPIRSRPDYGSVVMRHCCINEKGETVLMATFDHIFARKVTEIA